MLSKLTVVVALGYLLALIGTIIAFRWVGERWWVTVVAMYLPRIGFAIPLPFVVIAAALWAPRWVLATQALSAYLVVFPLMGLRTGLGRAWAASEGPEIRLVTYNIDNGARPINAVVARALEFEPDVVLFQEAYENLEDELRAAFPGWNVHYRRDLFIASRWPIQRVHIPASISYGALGQGGAHYVAYTLDTPLGLVDVFNVHFISPREGFDELRGDGLRSQLKSGRVFAQMAQGPIEYNSFRRRRQVERMSAAAHASSRPVIIAGDTNLPGLSWILATYFGDFRDGFASVGTGFGYTYPIHRPWLRIDRVMTNDKLRVSAVRLADRPVSDHLGVFASITRGD